MTVIFIFVSSFVFTVRTGADHIRMSTENNLYTEGSRLYNSGDYERAAGYFYAVFMRNPFDRETRSALEKSYDKIGKKLIIRPEYYFLPFRPLFKWAGLVLVVSASVIALANLFKQRKNLTIATALVFTLSLPFFLTSSKLDRIHRTEKAFILSKIPLREQPLYGSSYPLELEPGDVVEFKDERGIWLKVDFGSLEGWIPEDFAMRLN
ncbi:hypothetical protein JXL83_03580 [candidate division WOR-3 bacterium]|nr:hypothetical protein [candidate division WOR-3 bacterium]